MSSPLMQQQVATFRFHGLIFIHYALMQEQVDTSRFHVLIFIHFYLSCEGGENELSVYQKMT